MRYAVIHKPTNKVVNVIIYNGECGQWEPPTDHYIVPCTRVAIGDYYDEDLECFINTPSESTQE